MNRLSLSLSLLFASCCAAAMAEAPAEQAKPIPRGEKQDDNSHAEPETVTIPLSDMWGFRDLEMQPVTSLDPPTDDYPLTKAILNVLAPEWLKEKPKTAFAVTGSPSEALIKAHDVIVNKKPMQSEFATDEPLTLVFISYTGFHMSIKPVELRKGNVNKIAVNYFVKMSGRGDAQEYFAWIPLGRSRPDRIA
jgi:hypothetical protein